MHLRIIAIWAMLLVPSLIIHIPAGYASTPLPKLKNLGVAALVWEQHSGAALELEDNKSLLRQVLPNIVRASGRFNMIHHELVKTLVEDEKGRQRLKEEFELECALVLEARAETDAIHFVLKLIDPELNHLLIERYTMSREEFTNLSRAGLEGWATEFYYRLINRLPHDIYVTSIQGDYVTLSGGSEQGIGMGAQLELSDAVLRDRHPADGTWLDFSLSPAAKVEVFEVKNKSSIARVLSETAPHRLTVGQGAMVQAQPSREYYRQKMQRDLRERMPRSNDQVELVAPLYGEANAGVNGQATATGSAPHSSQTAGQTASPIANINPNGLSAPADPGTQVGQNAGPGAGVAPASKPAAERPKESLTDYLQDYADRVDAWFGAKQWSFSGPASASGKFPLWLVNSFGARVSKLILPMIHLQVGADFGFGGTGKGDYLSIAGLGRLVYIGETNEYKDFFDRYYLGASGSYQGMAVNKEKFGGGDWLVGGLIAGIESKLYIVGERRVFDGFAEFGLNPLTLGRFGYSGKRQGVKSSMGWQFNLGGYLEESPRSLEWGGLMGFSGTNMLFEDSQEGYLSTFQLQALLRYRL